MLSQPPAASASSAAGLKMKAGRLMTQSSLRVATAMARLGHQQLMMLCPSPSLQLLWLQLKGLQAALPLMSKATPACNSQVRR